MRVVVYDEMGDVALDYDTLRDTLSLCPGRLEKAQVIEPLQEAAFFIMDGPAPTPERRTFRHPVKVTSIEQKRERCPEGREGTAARLMRT